MLLRDRFDTGEDWHRRGSRARGTSDPINKFPTALPPTEDQIPQNKEGHQDEDQQEPSQPPHALTPVLISFSFYKTRESAEEFPGSGKFLLDFPVNGKVYP